MTLPKFRYLPAEIHEARVTELLTANNLLVERARAAERLLRLVVRHATPIDKMFLELPHSVVDDAREHLEWLGKRNQALPDRRRDEITMRVEIDHDALRRAVETMKATSQVDEPKRKPPMGENQTRAASVCHRAFGEDSFYDLDERVLRVLEEAIELAQAEGTTREQAHTMVDYVFNRVPGDPYQEAAGVAVTLLVYAEAKGFSLDHVTAGELDRVEANIDKIREKQAKKAASGVGRPPEFTPTADQLFNEPGILHLGCLDSDDEDEVEADREQERLCQVRKEEGIE